MPTDLERHAAASGRVTAALSPGREGHSAARPQVAAAHSSARETKR